MIKIEITAGTAEEARAEMQALLQGEVVSTGEVKAAIPEQKPKKAKKADPETKQEALEPEKEDEPKEQAADESGITYDQVKEMALQKARAKKKEEVKAILADAGVVRISDLKQSQYAEVYEKLESL